MIRLVWWALAGLVSWTFLGWLLYLAVRSSPWAVAIVLAAAVVALVTFTRWDDDD